MINKHKIGVCLISIVFVLWASKSLHRIQSYFKILNAGKNSSSQISNFFRKVQPIIMWTVRSIRQIFGLPDVGHHFF